MIIWEQEMIEEGYTNEQQNHMRTSSEIRSIIVAGVIAFVALLPVLYVLTAPKQVPTNAPIQVQPE